MDAILVTAIGSFAADVVIKGLQKNGYRVIGCDIYQKEWIANAYVVDNFYQVPLAVNQREYIERVKEICIRENVRYIMPLTDVEVDLYNESRKEFSRLNICVCISDTDTIRIARNKKALEEYLKMNTDIRTISTKYVKEANKNELSYPIICKPDNGRSSLGLKKINNQREWDNFVDNNDTDNYIVQPFIKGNVVTVDVICNNADDMVVTIPREELLRTLNGAGTSVRVFGDEKLETDCKKIAQLLNIKGCVNFEFIVDEFGAYYFLECNPRFSGGVKFSCMAGYDCIINHLKCYKGMSIDNFKLKNNMYIARKYEEYITHVE